MRYLNRSKHASKLSVGLLSSLLKDRPSVFTYTTSARVRRALICKLPGLKTLFPLHLASPHSVLHLPCAATFFTSPLSKYGLQLMLGHYCWMKSLQLGVLTPLLFRLQKAMSFCNLTVHGIIGSGGQYDFENDHAAYTCVIVFPVVELIMRWSIV